MESPISTYFSTNTIHKFVLFLASILLIFSLFFETKIIDNALVQRGAFTFVVIGLIWWLIYKIIEDSMNLYMNNERYSDSQKIETGLIWYWIWKVIIILGFIIGFSIIFLK